MAKGVIKLFHHGDVIDTKAFFSATNRREIIGEWVNRYRLVDKKDCWVEIELIETTNFPSIRHKQTGEMFNTVVQLALKIGMPQSTLWRKLKDPKKNDTDYEYITLPQPKIEKIFTDQWANENIFLETKPKAIYSNKNWE